MNGIGDNTDLSNVQESKIIWGIIQNITIFKEMYREFNSLVAGHFAIMLNNLLSSELKKIRSD